LARLAFGIAQFDPPELEALQSRSDLGRRTDDNDGHVLWMQALAGGPRHCLLGDRLHPILVGRVVVDWQSLRPHARAGTRRLVVAREQRWNGAHQGVLRLGKLVVTDSPDFIFVSSFMNSASASAVFSVITPPAATNGPGS